MSNPIYDMMKQMETQKDIAEINVILSGYENANGRNRVLDMQASEKIMEMQGKELLLIKMGLTMNTLSRMMH